MSNPKISIIVPCLNMASYIESTIKSILNQNYDNLELIIVDGGSTDGTLTVLKQYESNISILLTEKDDGMYHAIRKGIELSSGDIIAWLNADDIYFPWTLRTVANAFSYNTKVEWLCGIPAFLNEDGSLKKIYNNLSAKPKNAILNGWFKDGGYGFLQQESMFWKRELFYKAGKLTLRHRLAADFELWIKYAKYADLWSVNLPLAAFRLRTSSLSKKYKTKYLSEVNDICSNLKKLPLLLRLFGMNDYFNKMMRLLIWKRTKIIHQPFFSDCLIYEERFCSCSSITFSQLLLEFSLKKNNNIY